MTKWMLAAGAAALAIVSPALAEKGGQGGGKDKGGQAQKEDRGGGHSMKMDRGRGDSGDSKSERSERKVFGQSDDRGWRGNDKAKAHRSNDRSLFARNDRKDKGRDQSARHLNKIENRDLRVVGLDRDDDLRFVPRWNENGLVRGFHNGCPPGLAKKNNGCLPPGQAKKVGSLLPAALSNNMLDGAYRQWYRDNDDFYYRNDGDYIYRVRREGSLIDALFPSIDRDYYYYPVGTNYPSDFNFYNVPSQYSSFYPDGGNYNYRYGDGAIYQVNRSNGLIQGIAALLAGDLSVGQQLPMSYSAYNLPMSYRDQYYDTADNMYRYNDGYIYQVDPKTQLITAVINALI